jgi:hypothetical protein
MRTILHLISFVILISGFANAQTLYTLNLNDTSTYKITCGAVNSGIWTVNNNNCSLTTKNIILASSPSAQNINISATIEGSNMDSGDSATIQYSVNNIWTISKAIHGMPGTFTATYTVSFTANANSTIKVLINFFNDKGNEYWRLYNGKLTITDPQPLPVELLTFQGENFSNGIELEWNTANESENSFFIIERSQNGFLFEAIAKINGAGNSTTEKKYSFKDNEPLNGENFYRLKQTDWDGKENYFSQIIKLNYEKNKPVFAVYPNPSENSSAIINFDEGEKNEYLISLFDENGKKIGEKKIQKENSDRQLSLSDINNNLKAGIYFITASKNDNFFQQRIIIK